MSEKSGLENVKLLSSAMDIKMEPGMPNVKDEESDFNILKNSS